MQYLRLLQAGLALGWEDIPKPKGFIPSPSHNGTSIGTHRQVEHPIRMTSQRRHSLHLGVLPDIDLIEGISMGADELIEGSAEGEVADL